MTVQLQWTPVPNALSYNVYRSVFSGMNYDMIATNVAPVASGNVPPPNPGYTDGPGNLINGQNYFYVVTSVDTDGESTYSNEIAAVTPAPSGIPVVTATIS